MRERKTTTIRLSALRLGLSASVLALCTGAAAQAQEAAQPATTDEIVVTAQFREQRLQDTPLAITAVDSKLLESRSQTSLAEVANQAPSVVLRPTTAAFGPSITASIRGLGQIDFNPALEPGVGLYIDDVYYPRLVGANFDLLDVERIEILRGPQGTLTGRNSEGGAIKFISRKPTGEAGGYLSATYGIRNRINLRGSVDFTIAKDLFARISGTFADQEGYVKNIDYGCAFPASGVPTRAGGTNCVVGKDGDVGYKALRGIVRYNPSDAVDFTVSGDYIRDSRRNSAEVLLYANNTNPNVATSNGLPFDSRFICGRFCNYATTGNTAASFVAGAIPPLNGLPMAATQGTGRTEYKGWGLSANADFKLNDDLKLQSITAYRKFDTGFSPDGDLSPANVGFGISQLDSWFVSQELRLNAKLGDLADLTVGGFISDEKTTYYTLQDIRYVAIALPTGPLPLFPLQFIGNDPVRSKSKAAFATAIIHPAPALTITLGGRYTNESKAYTFNRFNLDGKTINGFLDPVGAANGAGYNGPNGKALTGSTGRFNGNRFDYRVSADYRFSPAVLAYATVSTGFKGGGIAPRPFNAAQAVPFGPEKLTAFELGLKTDLFDRRVRFNVSAYYNKFKGAQLTLLSCPQFGGPGPCAVPQNAGDADVKGLEAELFVQPVKGLQIDASASVLDWKWKCVVPAVVNPAGATSGCSTDPALVSQLVSPPRGVSKAQWSAGIQYEADLGSAGSITPRFDAAYQGAIAGTATIAPKGSPSDLYATAAAFTLANARLTWRNAGRDLDVSFEVTNLFDKYYFLSKFDLTGAGAGSISGMPGRPREWAVTVKKKF
ncbi:TonB-dependent receptor [Novosphingobium sp. PASSN1]|uniref:TonB-dependent receptor n=1 Tax=Novosphingobium sp. PASSN1 TaxID=2015561 RepID=UPI000BD02804|nr:TonB-dependent receptor [Novosphingobium sp. PASSN1]OYU37318.1 MAG: TonB-dependent receptor [Novosphingobium sp. PASSN1]